MSQNKYLCSRNFAISYKSCSCLLSNGRFERERENERELDAITPVDITKHEESYQSFR